MAAPAKRNSSVVSLRAKKTVATPPLSLGFSSLLEPDTYDPDKPTFKLNGHFLTGGAVQAFEQFLATKVLTEEAIEKIREEMVDALVANKVKPADAQKQVAAVKVISAHDWLAAKLKEPKENARFDSPHIVFANKATYKDKEGNVKERKVAVWDAKNKPLDLKKLRMSGGTVLEVVVYPNLFWSKLQNLIQPSLKLVGVRVQTLSQYGKGGSAPAETDEEAIKEVLGEAFEADDLAAYAAGGDEPHEDEPEDESALTPEEQAKGLF